MLKAFAVKVRDDVSVRYAETGTPEESFYTGTLAFYRKIADSARLTGHSGRIIEYMCAGMSDLKKKVAYDFGESCAITRITGPAYDDRATERWENTVRRAIARSKNPAREGLRSL